MEESKGVWGVITAGAGLGQKKDPQELGRWGRGVLKVE